MLKRTVNILAVCLILCLASCRNGKITLLTRQITSHTTYDLNSVSFANDSVGYICGGSKYAAGIILRTMDGGRTWASPDSINPRAFYCSFFFSPQEGMFGGFDGAVVSTIDSAHTFSTNQFSSTPIERLSFIDRQRGVAACGGGYKTGKVYTTTDGGASWTQRYSDSMHAYNGAAFLDDSTVVVCGYGTVLRSLDGGATFTVVRQNGDIYQDMKFIGSTGYAVGYQGEVIKSTDRGITWYTARAGNGVFSSPDHLLGVDFFDENNGYAVGESGLMVHTSNGGQDWQTVKAFTSERLRGVHMFSATSGIVVGAVGSVYLFQE
jgi:photosystem II stability/assembly factor-like uncharacterized protein